MDQHADQGIDQWVQQGIAQSPERESAESDVVEEVLSSPGRVESDPGSADQSPAQGASGGVEAPGEVDQPNATTHPTLDGQPGTASTPGDQAEHAAFTGDGAYSEGQAAGQNYHAAPVQD